jgi:hypothetical protein
MFIILLNAISFLKVWYKGVEEEAENPFLAVLFLVTHCFVQNLVLQPFE